MRTAGIVAAVRALVRSPGQVPEQAAARPPWPDNPIRWRWLLALPVTVTIGSSLPLMAQEISTESGPTGAPTGLINIIFAGGVVGAIIIFVLLALSLTAAYLIFDHLMTIRRKDLMPDGLGEQVRAALLAGDVTAAQQACNAQPSLLSFVLLHGISELEFGWNAVEKSLEDALAEQSARLFRKIEYLSVIGNIAPMVGLLGTVIGMIIAFQQVAVTQGLASAPQLAEGIYQALVTTVGGLIVAIPSIGAFAVFRNRIDQFVAEAAYTAQHVFTPLRRKARKT
jgi:biopolymer transport protein ExbB